MAPNMPPPPIFEKESKIPPMAFPIIPRGPGRFFVMPPTTEVSAFPMAPMNRIMTWSSFLWS